MSRPVIIYLFLQIFFDSILYYWEPQFHPLIREVVINIQVGCVLFAFFFTVLYLYVSMLHLKLIPFFQSHKDILKTIACDLVSAEEFVELEVCSFLYFLVLSTHQNLIAPSSSFQPLEPHPDDFMEHLQPYAQMYIKRKKEESGVCH